MDGTVVAAALLSALLHAAWNAAVKASPDPGAAMTAQVVGAGLLALPALAVLPLPGREALPWIAGSTLLNLLAVAATLRGYRAGGAFGLVYPVARSVSPLLVALMAAALLGDRPSPVGVAGIVAVSAGVALLATGADRGRPAVLLWSLAAGAASAAYAICDAQGARLSPSPLGYGCVMAAINAVAFGALHRARGHGPVAVAVRANPLVATLGAAVAMASYLLIIWVWTRAPIAVGAALRDTSVVFGALIGAVAFREPITPRRLVAIGLAAAGAGALRFA
jgi:drug/metabolite transporter (DMT)-like permease